MYAIVSRGSREKEKERRRRGEGKRRVSVHEHVHGAARKWKGRVKTVKGGRAR